MNAPVRHASVTPARGKAAPKPIARLVKRDPDSPALRASGRGKLYLRAGTTFLGRRFRSDTPVKLPVLEAGRDYFVKVAATGAPVAFDASAAAGGDGVVDHDIIGGFHFAPGGNARGNKGGDDRPAINPNSIWDVNFRPACPDPRGMALIAIHPEDVFGGRRHRTGGLFGKALFWCDIYLTAADHLPGTSRFDATIADGGSPPEKPGGGRYDKFDHATAVAVMKHHRKQLLSPEEFFAAAFGVTERSAAGADPVKTGLDKARTSRAGIMQATGNLWIWGSDGHPLVPRASLFGGSGWNGGDAGSRLAYLAYPWPVLSSEDWGGRGRCDHLQRG